MTSRLVRGLPERSTAMVRAFGPLLDRALYLGLGVAIVAAALLTIAVGEQLPVAVRPLVIAIVAAVVGLLTARASMPAAALRAWETFSWLGRAEMDRFVARTGGPVPTKPATMVRWLTAYPPTPENSLPRAEVLAFLGRTEEARRSLDLVPADTPSAAFELTAMRQHLDWLDGAPVDEHALTAAADRLGDDGPERRTAEVSIAVALARQRFVDGDPGWFEPLERARPGLGRAPGRVTMRDTWRAWALIVGVAAFVVSALLSMLRMAL
jgi:hypothetical protein